MWLRHEALLTWLHGLLVVCVTIRCSFWFQPFRKHWLHVVFHYSHVIMSATVFKINSISIVCAAVSLCLFRRTRKKTSKLHVSNAENISIWWHRIASTIYIQWIKFQTMICAIWYKKSKHGSNWLRRVVRGDDSISLTKTKAWYISSLDQMVQLHWYRSLHVTYRHIYNWVFVAWNREYLNRVQQHSNIW